MREIKQRGILMLNVIERDEEVRYINSSGCFLIEIYTNVSFFSFPNSGINIRILIYLYSFKLIRINILIYIRVFVII